MKDQSKCAPPYFLNIRVDPLKSGGGLPQEPPLNQTPEFKKVSRIAARHLNMAPVSPADRFHHQVSRSVPDSAALISHVQRRSHS